MIDEAVMLVLSTTAAKMRSLSKRVAGERGLDFFLPWCCSLAEVRMFSMERRLPLVVVDGFFFFFLKRNIAFAFREEWVKEKKRGYANKGVKRGKG